jgi:hypothetical protein
MTEGKSNYNVYKGPPRPGGTHAGTRYIARGEHGRFQVFDHHEKED